MPLYSFLSYFLEVKNLIVLDIIFSSLTIISIFLLTEKIFNDSKVAILSAFLFTIYPFQFFTQYQV